MAVVKPFKAVRPARDRVESVVALPYDVMNRKEAAKMAAGNPCNFLHISRAEIDLPEMKDPYDESVYEKARENIEENLNRGIFIEEEKTSLYIYRQQMNGRYQTGIVGCVSTVSYTHLDLKFPDPYSTNEKLSGKDVTFKVTINSKQVEEVPEYNVAFVKKNSEYDNLKDYEKSVKKGLLEEKKTKAETCLLYTSRCV